MSGETGVEGTDVLRIRYGENTTASSRTGTVTLRATGGTGTAQDTVLTLTQSGGASHTLVPMPTFTPVLVGGNLTASNGEISIALTLGGGATGWTAEESLGYVGLRSPNGVASEPVVVTYGANSAFTEREVVVSITTTGPTGVPITENISFTQAGAQGITVGTAPANLASLTATASSISVDVDLLGSATHWAAEITTGGDFLNLSGETGVEGDDVLTITYGENTTASSRTGTVTLRATGGTGATGSVVLTLTQSGGASHTLGNTPMFTPPPIRGNLTAAGGDISIALTLGGGATGWEATEALDYVSLTPDNGAGVTPVVVTYDANNTFETRPVVVSIITTGPTGVPITENISFTQAGSQGITVVTDPVNVSALTATASSILVDVDLLGSATHWAAEITTDPESFLIWFK